MKAIRNPIIIALALCAGLLAAGDARAQVSLGVHGGYNLDAFTDEGVEEGTYLVGGEARFGVAALPIVIRPGVSYFFDGVDDVTVLQGNADVLYPLGLNNAVFTPYVGLGLAITRVSVSADFPLVGNVFEDESTDIGASVVGGAVVGAGPVRPFAQGRITFGDHLAFVNEDGDGGPGYELVAGLLFQLGR